MAGIDEKFQRSRTMFIILAVGLAFATGTVLIRTDLDEQTVALFALIFFGVLLFAAGLREMWLLQEKYVHHSTLQAGLKYVVVFAALFGAIAVALVALAVFGSDPNARSDVVTNAALRISGSVIAGMFTGLVIAVIAPYLRGQYDGIAKSDPATREPNGGTGD